MTRIYRVQTARSKPEYYGDRSSTDREAQALADKTSETVTVEFCQLIDLSPARLVSAILNGKDWCSHHRIVRYVKPRPQRQQRAA